jgi:hypothetical protein
MEAIRMAEELKLDLILLDIGPPNLNGIEAEKRVGPLVQRIRLSFWRTNGASLCKPLYAQRLTLALRCRPHPSDLNVENTGIIVSLPNPAACIEYQQRGLGSCCSHFHSL